MHRYHEGLARSQRPPGHVSIKVSHPFRGETDDTETFAADSSPSHVRRLERVADTARRALAKACRLLDVEPFDAAPSWVSEGAR